MPCFLGPWYRPITFMLKGLRTVGPCCGGSLELCHGFTRIPNQGPILGDHRIWLKKPSEQNVRHVGCVPHCQICLMPAPFYSPEGDSRLRTELSMPRQASGSTADKPISPRSAMGFSLTGPVGGRECLEVASCLCSMLPCHGCPDGEGHSPFASAQPWLRALGRSPAWSLGSASVLAHVSTIHINDSMAMLRIDGGSV